MFTEISIRDAACMHALHCWRKLIDLALDSKSFAFRECAALLQQIL